SGFDFVAYYNRKLPVSISFDGVANDGEAGEGDNVGADVEGAGGGDGDDTLIGSDEANQLDGSRGDDTVSGGGGDDDINGDDGDDTVSGGAGNDSVEGDDGGDTIAGDDGDDTFNSEFFDGRADQISGGGGIDGYSDDSILGLTISLDGVADDGYRDPAEGPAIDNVGADVENLAVASFGGADDILIGNASANRIEGGPGDDRIEGLGGPDTVIGGSGDDDLDGGNGIDAIEGESGSDRIRSRDSKPDEIGCGSDVDVLLADSLDQFSVTCDSSSTGPLLKSSRAKLSRQGKGKVKVSCPQAEGIDCRVKLKVKKGKKTVARGSGRVKSGKSKKLTLKLTKAGRKANGKKLKGRATTGMTDAAGSNAATSRSLVLKKR
ncbi:MAG: hypothetical protein KDB62_06770, partial [Solirubrobacterales bacterium]|nr:hypothetical protein [Solirubrobacterales bacterium]